MYDQLADDLQFVLKKHPELAKTNPLIVKLIIAARDLAEKEYRKARREAVTPEAR